MKIYVASSWRNEIQPYVVEFLRGHGHKVSQAALERDEKGKSTIAQMARAHAHPIAEQGFKYDFDAMKESDACVLVLPSGNSAHLEAGWMCGQGKLVLVYADGLRKCEPELMYKFLGGMFDSLEAVAERLAFGVK